MAWVPPGVWPLRCSGSFHPALGRRSKRCRLPRRCPPGPMRRQTDGRSAVRLKCDLVGRCTCLKEPALGAERRRVREAAPAGAASVTVASASRLTSSYLVQKKNKNGGDRFQREALDQSAPTQAAAAEPSPAQSSGSCQARIPTGAPAVFPRVASERAPREYGSGRRQNSPVTRPARLRCLKGNLATLSLPCLPPRGLGRSPDSWLPASCGPTVMGGFVKTKALEQLAASKLLLPAPHALFKARAEH